MEDTLVFGVGDANQVVPGSAGKCNNLRECLTQYCRLTYQAQVDWICFSPGRGEKSVEIEWTWVSIILISLIILLSIYSIVVTVLLWQEKRSANREEEPLLQSQNGKVYISHI